MNIGFYHFISLYPPPRRGKIILVFKFSDLKSGDLSDDRLIFQSILVHGLALNLLFREVF